MKYYKAAIYIITVFTVLFLSVNSVYAAGVSLNFTKQNVSLTKGEQSTVPIRLDVSGQDVIGVDLFLTFDPKYIKLIDVVRLGAFSLQPAKIIDQDEGLVKTSLSNNYGTYVKESVLIAEVKVEALKPVDKTTIGFDFVRSNTKDTNVVAKGQDILETVNSVNIKIVSDGSSADTSDYNEQEDMNNDITDSIWFNSGVSDSIDNNTDAWASTPTESTQVSTTDNQNDDDSGLGSGSLLGKVVKLVDKDSQYGNPQYVLIGGAAVGLFFIVMIILMMRRLFRRRSSKRVPTPDLEPVPTSENNTLENQNPNNEIPQTLEHIQPISDQTIQPPVNPEINQSEEPTQGETLNQEDENKSSDNPTYTTEGNPTNLIY